MVLVSAQSGHMRPQYLILRAVLLLPWLGAAQGQTNDTTPGSAALSPMQKWCSGCHAPPRASSHPPQAWPSIVARMQRHRTMKGFSKIDDESLQQIIDYLQNHAEP